MKFVYVAKLVLKSALILAILSSILLSLHGSDRFKSNPEPDEMLGFGSIVNLLNISSAQDIPSKRKDSSKNNDGLVDSFKHVIKEEPDFIDVIQRLGASDERDTKTTNSVISTPSSDINDEQLGVGKNARIWGNSETNVKFTYRFWDSVRKDNPNGYLARNSSISNTISGPLMGHELYDLWRPIDGNPGSAENDRIVPQLVWQMEASKSSHAPNFQNKKIVVWDTFRWWNRGKWTGHHQLEESDCGHTPESLTKCTFTDDINEVSNADAVIATRDVFHTGEVPVPDGVLKFYFMLESPFHSWAMLNRTEDLLATYWRGSDLVTPYAKWVYYDPQVKLKPQGKNYHYGKTKPGAIFVSNCGSWNGRMDYINELQKHIQIDVYGNCGTLRCDKSQGNACFRKLKKDYFFYFAFENSNCRDYVTEKLFTNGLQNDLIPIVLGAHPDDYKALAPHKSYLHIEDFESPKHLAEYMQHLIDHPAAYNEFFDWKGTGEVITSDLFCRLCAMVHYADLKPPPKRNKTYRWGHVQAIESGMCLPANQWYWTKKNQ